MKGNKLTVMFSIISPTHPTKTSNAHFQALISCKQSETDMKYSSHETEIKAFHISFETFNKSLRKKNKRKKEGNLL